MFLKMNFLGMTPLMGYSPKQPNFVDYDSITFYGSYSGCVIDSVWGQNIKYSKKMIDDMIDKGYDPLWNDSTYLLARFNNNLNGGNITNINTIIKDWIIYRRNVDENQMEYVATISAEQDSFTDYKALRDKTYQYYMYAQSDTELSSPITTEEVECQYYHWCLIDIEKNAVYHFKYNFTGGALTVEESWQEYQTNSQYNTFVRGKPNYLVGSVQALVAESMMPFEQSADFIDQFRECICSDRVKYLKDAKGHIFKVFTYGFADTGLCDSDDTPRMISFNFKECGPVD